MSTSSDDRLCSHHGHAPAVAVCAECGEPICGDCHGFDARGFAVCDSCRRGEEVEHPLWERVDTDYSPKTFALTLLALLRHPRSFFDDVPPSGPVYPAAVFGFTSLVIGLLVGRVWQFLFVEPFAQEIASIAAERALSASVAQTLSFVVIPLVAAGAGALHLALLKGATRLADVDCSWETACRITGYALGGTVLMLVPPVWGISVGRFLAVVWVFNLEVSALRDYFEMGPWRSMFTALVPMISLMVCGV